MDKQTKIDSQGISNEHFLLLWMQELMVNADKQTEIDSQGISNEHFLLLGMQELMVNADKHGRWRHLCGALLDWVYIELLGLIKWGWKITTCTHHCIYMHKLIFHFSFYLKKTTVGFDIMPFKHCIVFKEVAHITNLTN